MTDPIPNPLPTRPWQPRLLLLLLLLGFGLRLAYVRLIDTPPFSDMADYETMALNLLDGQGLVMSDLYKAYRPPAYPLLIAAIYSIAGARPFQVLLVQCLLSIFTVWLVYLLVVHLFRPHGESTSSGPDPGEIGGHDGNRARTIALVTAALFCFEETSIFFCGQLLTETLFTFLFCAWGYLLVRTHTRPNLAAMTCAGVIGGLAILTRPNFGPLVLAGAWWYFRSSRPYFSPPPGEWRQLRLLESPYAPPFVMLVYASLVVSLWTIRNQAVLHHFVPVSTNSGVNLYLGHHEDFGYNSFGNKEGIRMRLRARGSYDEVIENQVFILAALRFIQQHPWEDLSNNLSKIYHLYLAPANWQGVLEPWTWFSYLDAPYRPWPWETQRRELRFWPVVGEGGEREMPHYKEFFWKEGRLPLVFWGWPMILLTLVGMGWTVIRRERVGFLFLVIAVYTAVLVVYFANARFRAPLLPFLYPFAAYTLVSLFQRSKTSSRGSPTILDQDPS